MGKGLFVVYVDEDLGSFRGTLATLDLRGNSLHSGIVSRLQRTMEEKRYWDQFSGLR